jgi:hypothetical protein
MTDGVPTDSHTAATLEDYADTGAGHGDGRDRGMLLIPSEELNEQMIRYDAMGLTVKLHAAGDAAVRQSLDAIAAAREANGLTGLLHDVSHNSFVAPEDLARAAELDAVLEFSPYIWFASPIVESVTQAVGAERMERWIPVREALDAGVFTVVGSDWNVVPSINPWLAMETLVTRRPPEAAGGPRVGGREAITLEEAFAMFTINAAPQMCRADKVGTLEPGKIATSSSWTATSSKCRSKRSTRRRCWRPCSRASSSTAMPNGRPRGATEGGPRKMASLSPRTGPHPAACCGPTPATGASRRRATCSVRWAAPGLARSCWRSPANW